MIYECFSIKAHNIVGFSPTLLQLVMSEQVKMPVRQAGAIYLKNMINQYWIEQKPAEKPGEVVPFSLYEQDKQVIRDNLIEAVIHSPDPIRLNFVFLAFFISSLRELIAKLFLFLFKHHL